MATLAAPRHALGRSLMHAPVYPVLGMAALIIMLHGIRPLPAEAVVRPTVVAVGAAVLIQVALTAIARDPDIGAFFALASVLGLFAPPLAAIAVVLAAGYVIRKKLRQEDAHFPWRSTTSKLNALALILLAVTTCNALLSGSFTPIARSSTPSSASRALPNVYLLLLDGHPRRDTLREQFHYDLGPFIETMSELGFRESASSTANYNATILTLTSLFNMSLVDDVPALSNPPTDPGQQQRTLQRAMNDGRAIRELRLRGYEIITVPSPFIEFALLGADRVVDTGHLTTFELDLIARSSARMLPDLARELTGRDLRLRVNDTLETTATLAAERSERPRFVFAHVMSPHPPRLFGSSGEPREATPCYPQACSMWDAQQSSRGDLIPETRDQIQYLDQLVADTARSIVAADPAAVVIVMSDHGNRHDVGDPEEMLRSLFLARTPGKIVFPDNVMTVNVVTRLLNGYADAQVALAPREHYWLVPELTTVDGYFSMKPWYE